MTIILIALAPVIALLFYVYFRDKYEKEPIGLLLKGFFAGVIILFPCAFIESYTGDFVHSSNTYYKAFWDGFMVAGLTEEAFKFLVLIIIFWKSRHFNEKFDGIVYAVFVSLGFAAMENIFYVSNYGISVGFLRAFTAVPAHALFGITMGSYLGLAKFNNEPSGPGLWAAFFYPWFFHGVYDFLLMSENAIFILLELPFMFFLIRKSFKRMKRLSDESIFKNSQPNDFR